MQWRCNTDANSLSDERKGRVKSVRNESLGFSEVEEYCEDKGKNTTKREIERCDWHLNVIVWLSRWFSCAIPANQTSCTWIENMMCIDEWNNETVDNILSFQQLAWAELTSSRVDFAYRLDARLAIVRGCSDNMTVNKAKQIVRKCVHLSPMNARWIRETNSPLSHCIT